MNAFNVWRSFKGDHVDDEEDENLLNAWNFLIFYYMFNWSCSPISLYTFYIPCKWFILELVACHRLVVRYQAKFVSADFFAFPPFELVLSRKWSVQIRPLSSWRRSRTMRIRICIMWRHSCRINLQPCLSDCALVPETSRSGPIIAHK